jgi:hypothetical protein
MNTTNFIVNGQGDLGNNYRLMPVTQLNGGGSINANGVTITFSSAGYLIQFYTPGFYLVTASSFNAGNTTQITYITAVGLNAGQGPDFVGFYNGKSVATAFTVGSGNPLCSYGLNMGDNFTGNVVVTQLSPFT